jgi:DNA invertase Pin-like site-specific DNA recombinase
MTETRFGRPLMLTTLQEFELRQFREAGVSIRDCAAYFNISKSTVYRVLSKQRKKLGPEKLPRGQMARSHLTRRDNLQQ